MKRGRRNANVRRGRNVLNSFVVIFVMISFVGIMMYQIHNLKEENEKLGEKEASYQKMYENESERTSELEEAKIYVQTKEYVEEMAKKLGYVYPDEIIFKPADK